MSFDNPYESPATDEVDGRRPSTNSQSFDSIARSTFLAWEKLRIIYIAVLALLTLALGAGGAWEALGMFRFWAMVIPGAIVANLCFFAGPIVDTYVTWLGLRGTWLRWILFALGTGFASLLVLGIFAGALFP